MSKHQEHIAQVAIALIRQHQLLSNIAEKRDSVLGRFESSIPKRDDGFQAVFDVYNYVFALLDSVVRYHKMAHTLPGISKKNLPYRRLDDAVDHFKDARNQIQHLNNDVINDFSGPLMGAITWPNGVKNYNALLNDVGRVRSTRTLTFDTKTASFAHGLCYVYNEKHYDLDAAVSVIHEFHSNLISKMVIRAGEADFDPLSNIAAFEVSYEINRK